MNLKEAELLLKQWQKENTLAKLLEAMCIVEKEYLESKYLIYNKKFCYTKDGIKIVKTENINAYKNLSIYVLMAHMYRDELLGDYTKLLDLFE